MNIEEEWTSIINDWSQEFSDDFVSLADEMWLNIFKTDGSAEKMIADNSHDLVDYRENYVRIWKEEIIKTYDGNAVSITKDTLKTILNRVTKYKNDRTNVI